MPDLGQQLKRIDLSAVERHRPIVETAPAPGDTLHRVWLSEDDAAAFARRLAACPALRNAFIELHGDLGAGKTTLARHLLRALGVTGRIKSPTYAVVESYSIQAAPAPVRQEPVEGPSSATPDRTELSIWHFDFYRFNDPREWEEAGFRDVFASPGLKLAEWPEKAAGVLPVADLAVTIETLADERREVTLRARTPAGRALLEAA